MTERTSLYQLIERGLGEDLEGFITSRRQYAYPWRAIARELSDRVQIEISDQTLRRWFESTDSDAERVA